MNETDLLEGYCEPATLAWCRQLPKVEIHAHLNGSVRDSTLRELCAAAGKPLPRFKPSKDTPLSECFALFPLIHKVTGEPQIVERITREMIEDFAAENCKYLEIRSTPRETAHMSKRQYMDAVLKAVCEQNANCELGILVAVLVSISRAMSCEEALEVVELAHSYMEGGLVVGIDLSGDPLAGEFSCFVPALTRARQLHLKLSVHMAEVVNHAEVMEILSFKPDRVGHAIFLDSEATQLLLDQCTPLEACLTSNVMTGSVEAYHRHHVRHLLQHAHPVIFCTDDKYIFGTTLSEEYAIAARAFELSRAQLFANALSALEHIFQPPHVRQKLHQLFEACAAAAVAR